jgi:hypothetical protein
MRLRQYLLEMPGSIEIEGMTLTKRVTKNIKKKLKGDEEAFKKWLAQKLGMGISGLESKEMAGDLRRALAYFREV